MAIWWNIVEDIKMMEFFKRSFPLLKAKLKGKKNRCLKEQKDRHTHTCRYENMLT